MRSLQLDTTSPPGARILYAGITGGGVFRSNDGGQTWTSILSGTTPVLANELNTAGTPGPARSAGKRWSHAQSLRLRPIAATERGRR